jgi:molecular chaperone DnaK (HSP70)
VTLRQKVVAAIDFGTHATGYAWAVINEHNRDAKRRRIYVKTQWPSQPVAYPKNLTSLLLDDNDEVIAWGFDAKRQWHRRRDDHNLRYVYGFKMWLVGDTAHSDAGKTDHTSPTDTETAKRLIVEYLRRVYRLAMEEISKSGYTDEEVRWCLTVPAIWDEYQKQLMRQAAVSAGLPSDDRRLILALEPEAAAHHARLAGVRTVGSTAGRRASLMSAGSKFMVVDCGGGTVDITAYRVDRSGRLIEIGRDYGDSLGAEFINKGLVSEVFASRFGSFDRLFEIVRGAPTAFDDMLDAWERAKLHVTVDLRDDIYLPIPAAVDRLLDNSVREGLAETQGGITDQVVITSEEAKAAFETVVPAILDLVDHQLQEVASKASSRASELVVLVGGFGASPYLQRRLADHLKERAEVLVPGDPNTAVLYGATHFAYDPQTRARRTKATYGCGVAWPFKEGVDPEWTRVVPPDGQPRCSERFDTFVVAGQTVPSGEVVTHNYVPLYPDQKAITVEIYRTSALRPRYTFDKGSEEVGSVSMSLEAVMDLPLWRRSVDVTMHFGETEIRVSGRLTSGGEPVETTITFEPSG